jgi:hypothetical protein
LRLFETVVSFGGKLSGLPIPRTPGRSARKKEAAPRRPLCIKSALEDAEDYKAFELAITADYDAQSAVERELARRLASLLWRLQRATTIETGLFEIQADHLSNFRRTHLISPASREIV